MKKVMSIIAVALFTATFVACGPSAEEKAKMDKMLKESLKESATDLFQCSRCKKRKTIYCEVQTRSSDEPMTKFITCLECGYKWKQY